MDDTRINRVGFLKLLALTASSIDAEALAALRKAHQTLSRAGLSWPDVVAIPAQYTAPPRQQFMWAGETLAPPIGETWRATIVFLASRMAGRYPSEQLWLDRLAATQQAAGDEPVIDAADAARIVAIHRADPCEGPLT